MDIWLQEQTTERKFKSMSELVKEFKAQYSQTLSNGNVFTHCNNTGEK